MYIAKACDVNLKPVSIVIGHTQSTRIAFLLALCFIGLHGQRDGLAECDS